MKKKNNLLSLNLDLSNSNYNENCIQNTMSDLGQCTFLGTLSLNISHSPIGESGTAALVE